MRLLPASLFGRTMLVLVAGLIVAQLGSIAIHLFDRGSSVYRLASLQIARADRADRAHAQPAAGRRARKVVQEVGGPHLRAALSTRAGRGGRAGSASTTATSRVLRGVQRQIGARWPIRVDINPHPRRRTAPRAGAFELWMARHFYFLLPEPFSIVVQVVLEDGTVAVFDVNVPQEPLQPPRGAGAADPAADRWCASRSPASWCA